MEEIKKIYSCFVGSKNEDEYAQKNDDYYKELTSKYKILRVYDSYVNQDELNSNDIVIYQKTYDSYSKDSFEILKRPASVTNDELALICGYGWLGFGYYSSSNGQYIEVYTD